MNVPPGQCIVTVVLLGVFLGLMGCAAFLDPHQDPFYHATCPICKWQLGLSAILLSAVTSIAVPLVASRDPLYELNPPIFKRLCFAFYRLRAPPFAPLT